MKGLTQFIQQASGIISGFVVTMITFGLVLAFLYALPDKTTTIRLVGVLVSAALALLTGSFTVGKLSPTRPMVAALVFGLIFSGCAFSYVLHSSPLLLPFTAAGLALAAAGGWLSQVRPRQHSK